MMAFKTVMVNIHFSPTARIGWHLVMLRLQLPLLARLRDPVRNIWVVEFGMIACLS